MGSLRSHEGYLIIDNRGGPGVSEEMVRKSGKDVVNVGEGAVLEMSVLTCSHCHKQMMINPLRNRTREFCRKCNHYICDACGGIRKIDGGECRSLNDTIDRIQNQLANRRS